MPPLGSRRIAKRKKKPRTDADELADYAVRLLKIAAELRPYGNRALDDLSRDEAWNIRTEFLTIINVLQTVQMRLMDPIYKSRP